MNQASSHRLQGTWIAIGLFALTLVSRIPFRSEILYHWDSVNFAYAMQEFSVAKEQPQPPGYIVYVWLCRLVDLFFGDAQTTMVWISVIASALAVVTLFYLGRAMFNSRIGLMAALFMVTSPLFWFYGEIALPHSLDMLLVIVGVWWLYETMKGQHAYLYPAMAVIAIAGGVRPQTLVFLAPLILFALRKVGWKQFLLAGALGTGVCLAWFVPLAALSGGINAYLEAMGAYTGRFNATTSVFMGGGWWGVQRNLLKLTMYTLFGWSAALLPFVAHAAARVWRREWPGNMERLVFFALWLVPTLIFYTIIHMGQQGLVFVFLPALMLWGAWGFAHLFASGSERRVTLAAAVLLAINMGLFLLAPEYPLSSDRIRLLSRTTLVHQDGYYQERFEAIKSNFPPESTAILAANLHHVVYYLPEYVHLPFIVGSKWEVDEGRPAGNVRDVIATPVELGLQPNDRGEAVIVVFDPGLMAFNEGSEPSHELSLQHEGEVEYFVLTRDRAFHYGAHSFGIREN